MLSSCYRWSFHFLFHHSAKRDSLRDSWSPFKHHVLNCICKTRRVPRCLQHLQNASHVGHGNGHALPERLITSLIAEGFFCFPFFSIFVFQKAGRSSCTKANRIGVWILLFLSVVIGIISADPHVWKIFFVAVLAAVWIYIECVCVFANCIFVHTYSRIYTCVFWCCTHV
jgi:hypothetical protein